MKAEILITGISQLVTAESAGPKHGQAMRELKMIQQAAIAISAGVIVWTGKGSDWKGEADVTVNAGGRAVVPGLVDPHTHAVWAGNRLVDFEARTSGSTYEEILAAGGGIRSTIRATAAASQEDLVALAKPRIDSLIASGATTIEVKSGYGFTLKQNSRCSKRFGLSRWSRLHESCRLCSSTSLLRSRQSAPVTCREYVRN